MKQDKYNHSFKVDEVLESLDSVSRVEPRPFFYTRVNARLQSEVKVERRFTRWSLAMAAILVGCLIINTARFTVISSNHPQSDVTVIQELYNMNPSISYPLENKMP